MWLRSVRRGVVALTLVATANVLVACGEDESPAEAVPALANHLERVDQAIADDQPDRVRRAVEALVDEATQARMDGRITADQADEILRAAGELLERLGAERDDGDPTDPATPTPPIETPQDEEEGDEPEGDGEGHDDEGKEDGKGDKGDKGKGDEKGHGD